MIVFFLGVKHQTTPYIAKLKLFAEPLLNDYPIRNNMIYEPF